MFLTNVENFYKGREKIIEGFKNKIFPFNYDEAFEERLQRKKKHRKEEEERSIRNENGHVDYEEFDRLIDIKKRDINDKLVKKHFQVNSLNDMQKELKGSKINLEKNRIQVSMIKSRLKDLEEEIEDMSEPEKEIEGPDEIVDIIKRILEFNRNNKDKG